MSVLYLVYCLFNFLLFLKVSFFKFYVYSVPKCGTLVRAREVQDWHTAPLDVMVNTRYFLVYFIVTKHAKASMKKLIFLICFPNIVTELGM